MKVLYVLILSFYLLSGSFLSAQNTSDYNELTSSFASPVQTFKPTCFCWWINSLANKESITRDQEELKGNGMGGVTLICSSNRPKNQPVIPVRGPEFLSKEWREL